MSNTLKIIPELIVREAAKRNFINFAKYMNSELVITPLHYNFYKLLDLFAHKKIYRLIISMQPQIGKALDIYTPVFTTKGWKNHGDLKAGDIIFGQFGEQIEVIQNFGAQKQYVTPILFSNNSLIKAHLRHEWIVTDTIDQKEKIIETEQFIREPERFYIKYRKYTQFLSDNNCDITLDKNYKKIFIKKTYNEFKTKVNCIQVQGGIYLAGEKLIPTHNSEGASRLLPAYVHGIQPNTKIVINSYSSSIAKGFNKDVQKYIAKPEYANIFPATMLCDAKQKPTLRNFFIRNASMYEVVNHTGSLIALGRAGALTSKTVDLAIVDDLYKNMQEANSPIVLKFAWEWYKAVVRTRLHNESQELIVFTRWNENDIIGKIQENEKVIEPKTWKELENLEKNIWVKINFEAIKTGPPTEIDPRIEGEVFWPERHSLERILEQKSIDPVGFQCLYQGNPSSSESRLYHDFKTYTDKNEWGRLLRIGCYIDSKDKGTDNFACVTYEVRLSNSTLFNERTRRNERIIYALVTDIVYNDRDAEFNKIAASQSINANGVQMVWIESNGGGSYFTKMIKTRTRAILKEFHQMGNKEGRIIGCAHLVNVHIIMPFDWQTRFKAANSHLETFLREFNANDHDDIEDALTGIYEKEIATYNLKPYYDKSSGIKVR